MQYRLADWRTPAADLQPGDVLVLDLYEGPVCRRRAVAVIREDNAHWTAYIGASAWEPVVLIKTGTPLFSGTAKFLFPKHFFGDREYTQDDRLQNVTIT
jgi:hypothetical protein